MSVKIIKFQIKIITSLLVLSFGLLACQSSTNNDNNIKKIPALTISTAKVYSVIALENYPNESYAIYIPKDYQITQNYPLFLFCDPQGSGAYPVSKYQSLAERYHAILIGVNNSKNGIEINSCLAFIDHTLAEAKELYAIDDSSIFLCGFSGGAKVAGIYASTHPEISFLICGGAMPSIEQTSTQIPILLFAGNEDMNYTDLYGFQEQVKQKGNKHQLHFLEFDGKHEWPDSFNFEYAFCLINKANTLSIEHKKFIQTLKSKSFSSILQKLNHYQVAIDILKSRADVSVLQNFVNTVSLNSSTKALLASQAKQVSIEQGMKDYYAPFIGVKDLRWWAIEVNKLNHPENKEDKAMCKRVLGFLSLAGYSYSNRAINQNDFATAKKILDFYQVVDPTNSDQAYLSAMMFAKMGEKDKSNNEIKRTIAMGFNNKTKIMNEASFQSMLNDEEFKKNLSSLK